MMEKKPLHYKICWLQHLEKSNDYIIPAAKDPLDPLHCVARMILNSAMKAHFLGMTIAQQYIACRHMAFIFSEGFYPLRYLPTVEYINNYTANLPEIENKSEREFIRLFVGYFRLQESLPNHSVRHPKLSADMLDLQLTRATIKYLS